MVLTGFILPKLGTINWFFALVDELSDYAKNEVGDYYVPKKEFYCFVVLYFTVVLRRINFVANFLRTNVKTQRDLCILIKPMFKKYEQYMFCL
jgi:hypothetical protein